MVTKQAYERDGQTYLTPEYYQYLLASDLVVDGSAGGLILGPSHRQGGIQTIHFNRDAEVYLTKRVEGWQFAINTWADIDNRDEINSLCPSSVIGDSFFLPYEVPADIDVLRVTPKEMDGAMITPYLVYGTDFTAYTSKEAAKKNLRRFTEMNRAAWQKHFVGAQPKETIRESAFIARFAPRGEN